MWKCNFYKTWSDLQKQGLNLLQGKNYFLFRDTWFIILRLCTQCTNYAFPCLKFEHAFISHYRMIFPKHMSVPVCRPIPSQPLHVGCMIPNQTYKCPPLGLVCLLCICNSPRVNINEDPEKVNQYSFMLAGVWAESSYILYHCHLIATCTSLGHVFA